MSDYKCTRCGFSGSEDNPPYWCPKCDEKEWIESKRAKAAQPEKPGAGEITAKEFVTWLSAKYEKTDHQPTTWAVSGELNHMIEERAAMSAEEKTQ